MNVLVVGQGGREHAILKALSQSSKIDTLYALPGNSGILKSLSVHNLDADLSDYNLLLKNINNLKIDLVIIGPEVPLSEGMADFLRNNGVKVFGPNKNGAQLESSKIFAKNFMLEANVPTGKFKIVQSVQDVKEASKLFQPPFILKADGLAAGKGVFICDTLSELYDNSKLIFEDKIFGEAGSRAIIEEFLPGWELSFLILTNGKDYCELPLTQDHKRLLDGDKGPNTGGMGVVGPIRIEEGLVTQIKREIIEPTINNLNINKIDYRGVIYFGIMITEAGPKVLEYNVRFGDPEAQVIIPLVKTDWLDIFHEVANGKVPKVEFKDEFATCIVLASEGYPERPVKGAIIDGDLLSNTQDSYFLHCGTTFKDGQWQTNGGRVLNAIALGSTLTESINKAYQKANEVNWNGMQSRSDIGSKVLKNEQ